jgi:serine/tyrosine/threonine adenylyltransferase
MNLLQFDNTYISQLPGFSLPCQPAAAPEPQLLFFNEALATELRMEWQGRPAGELASIFVGNQLPPGAEPVAQAYAGHQFGHFVPQLGDGRALLLGEVLDQHGQRRDIALKGSGRTPFSRGGDGKAAIGPMLREVIIGEALHALGLPTTRALAVVATGEPVYREIPLPGAVLTRVASSHIRVGTFEFFAARGEVQRVKQLADYTIARHYPELGGSEDIYRTFLTALARRQAELIAQWMGIGFIHGVMNTDNMALSGESIDFGPCAFLESYHPMTVFSSIDRQGRYAFARQPAIARWNLARFGEAILPLLHEEPEAAATIVNEVLEEFSQHYQAAWLGVLRRKLGLAEASNNPNKDAELAQAWLQLLQDSEADYTLSWRALSDAADGNEAPLRALISKTEALNAWLTQWRARLATEAPRDERAAAMRRANPWLVARNHRVEEALSAATAGRMQPLERLLMALRDPFTETPEYSELAEPAPAAITASYRTFCGT